MYFASTAGMQKVLSIAQKGVNRIRALTSGGSSTEQSHFIALLEGKLSFSKPRIVSTGGYSVGFTRSLGDKLMGSVVIPEPEFSAFEVQRGSLYRVIIASDGVWDVFNPQMCFDSVFLERDSAIAAESIADAS